MNTIKINILGMFNAFLIVFIKQTSNSHLTSVITLVKGKCPIFQAKKLTILTLLQIVKCLILLDFRNCLVMLKPCREKPIVLSLI